MRLLTLHIACSCRPLTFELTNQDSEGRESSTFLQSMHVSRNRKGIALGKLSPLETALIISKPMYGIVKTEE